MPTTQFNFQYQRQGNIVHVLLEGVEVMQVYFNAENLALALFAKITATEPEPFLRMADNEQRARIYDQLKERFAQKGLEMADEEIYQHEPEALRAMERHAIKDSIEAATKRVDEHLEKIVEMINDKILHAAFYGGANELRDILKAPEQKYSAREMRDAIFESDWQLLKPLLGISSGGPRNVKHVWTDEDRQCLAEQYERLKPIWLEAKRIAKAAQNATEHSRRKRWAEAVAATYPELKSDLIERLAPDSSDARPADIALIHAARICIPAVRLTVRKLREEIRKWKSKSSA